MNRRALVAGVVGAGAAALALLLYDPFDDHAFGCPLYEATGLFCPGCGASRATWLLLHGDLVGVLRHNPLLLPALAYLVARWLHTVAPASTRWLPRFVRAPTAVGPRAMQALAALLVVFAAARNLPSLDWLAPPDPRTGR